MGEWGGEQVGVGVSLACVHGKTAQLAPIDQHPVSFSFSYQQNNNTNRN